MSERLDVRLTEEEKNRLAELAKQKNISMTDLVRTWIVRGDIVHVLAEQLHDFVNDFDKWHISDSSRASIVYLCKYVQARLPNDPSIREIMYEWTAFFDQSFGLLVRDVNELRVGLNEFVNRKETKDKVVLVGAISDFTQIVHAYHSIFVRTFMRILENIGEHQQKDAGGLYNDNFRTRYNELASKYEDFLKRAQRELGEGLAHAVPRAGEFRPKE